MLPVAKVSCVYDIETVSTNPINAYEAAEYAATHGSLPQQPVIITIPDDELSRLYAAIKSYGFKRKDTYGTGVIVKELKEIFGNRSKG